MLQCPRSCKISNLSENAKYCPICGSRLEQSVQIEDISKNKKYQVVQHWLQREFYSVALEKFNPRAHVLEILHEEARYAVDKYLILGRVEIQLKYVKNVNSLGESIHSGCLDLVLDRRMWYALFHPEKTGDTCWEYVKTCGCSQVKKFQRKYALVDYDNVVILSCEYDDIQELPSGFIKFRKDGKYGLLNIESSYSSENNAPKITMLADCQYDCVFDFKHGYAKVQKGKEWYMIDKTGNIKMKQRQNNMPYKPSIWLPIEICDRISEITIHCLQKLEINKIIIGSTLVIDADNLSERHRFEISSKDSNYDVFTIKNNADALYGTLRNEDVISFCFVNQASMEYKQFKQKINNLIQNEIIMPVSLTQELHIYETEDSILRIISEKGAIIIEIIYSNSSIINLMMEKNK